ncbi:MAG: hypothetical protein WBN75_02085 [Verrucomicrobiia bacterium]
MATDPTVTVATGFLSLEETPMSISSFMGRWCFCNEKLRFWLENIFQARADGKEKERRGKVESAKGCQAAESSALMQN